MEVERIGKGWEERGRMRGERKDWRRGEGWEKGRMGGERKYKLSLCELIMRICTSPNAVAITHLQIRENVLSLKCSTRTND